MSEAEKLLKMIEEVDPADTDMLDEIDARAYCFFKRYTFLGIDEDNWKFNFIDFSIRDEEGSEYGAALEEEEWYTRSRDALKKARPEGWHIQGSQGVGRYVDRKGDSYWSIPYGKGQLKLDEKVPPLITGKAPTEETAELHAIIQVEIYEGLYK